MNAMLLDAIPTLYFTISYNW